MRRYRLPPLLRHIWTELTRPPAMLGRLDAPAGPAQPGEPGHHAPRSNWRAALSPMLHNVRDLRESPTDDSGQGESPPGSARQAERVSQSYFRLRRYNRYPAKKPRPRVRRRIRPEHANGARRRRGRGRWRSGGPSQPGGARAAARVRHTGRSRSHSHGLARDIRPVAGATRGVIRRGDRAAAARVPSEDHLAKALGQHVTAIEPVDNVWKILTDSGRAYALKATALPPERVRWLAKAIEELHRRGFTNPARIQQTADGDWLVQDGPNLFYATEWLAGRRADFGSTREVGAAARALARLHELSRDVPGLSRQPQTAFAVVETLESRLREMRRHAALAEEGADAFAALFAAHAPARIADAEGALELVRSPAVDAQLATESLRPGLGHLDVTRRNLLWDGERARIIDFDTMAPAPRALDLAHLIRRAMQARGSWSGELAVAPLVAYNRIRTLNPAEYVLLEGLLRFPHRFWRLGRMHYPTDGDIDRRGGNDQALEQLTVAVAQEVDRQAFLEAFARQVTRLKNV